ncbi:hypothetical protein AURDEDRAFT_177071 [Auricularia subglabra TFB-10046 SS5]|uniref:Uncharacterized protein n=1 Tax=Auricularia subglabra (strain TFB-10046 / SS5) TaxID=717982 RepID=J0LBN6_AURST|nr:hypothetical protein AURDEDRAFT_177071 [Auricularia subglabra TFB-10046 SS5]
MSMITENPHSAQFVSPMTPDVPPLPTSLATVPSNAHTLPARNPHRNSTLSTLSDAPSLSAFSRLLSSPPVPAIPAAAVLAKHQHAGGTLALPALSSLKFSSPLSVSFGDWPRSLFSSMGGPPDFLSPFHSSSSGLASMSTADEAGEKDADAQAAQR